MTEAQLPRPEVFRALVLQRYVEYLRTHNYPGIPINQICEALFEVCGQLYDQNRSSLNLNILSEFADRCVNFCKLITDAFIRSAKPWAAVRTWEEFRSGREYLTPFTIRLSEFFSTAEIAHAAHISFMDMPITTAATLQSNIEAVSFQNLSRRDFEEGRRLYPAEFAGDELSYTRGTPLNSLTEVRFPYPFFEQQRRAHTMMVAGSDRGKTQTLEAMICADFLQDNPPGMVVIDSKGDMFNRLSRLAVFDPDNGRLKDRIILIDPRDSPALNPFSVRLEGKNEETVGALLSQLAYFFEALFGTEFSGPMRTLLNPLAELMLNIPDPSLFRMLDAFDDITQFSSAFPLLSPHVRRYFEKDFKDITAKATVGAVKGRIYSMMNQCPAFGRMFNAPSNSLDMYTALNEGKIILVSTEQGYLRDASPVFARYIVSLANGAALSRSSIPENQRRQAYLYLDEAGPYFDDRTPALFQTLRSYGLGIVAAFQDFSQASATLRNAMTASTSIKLIAGGSHADATILHREMNLDDPAYIFNQGFEHRGYTDWACYIRNRTKSAVSLRAPHGYLDQLPRMTDEKYARFRARNLLAMADGQDSATPPAASTLSVHSLDDEPPTAPAKYS